jgi:alkylation response protein AidB-like acyl-CoA dehydrogenase
VFTFGWDEPDHPIPARSTEVEITQIYEGTNQIQRVVIAKKLLG